ncbi:MAG: O-antigen ligase family protein [Pseudomonadota bacterium]
MRPKSLMQLHGPLIVQSALFLTLLFSGRLDLSRKYHKYFIPLIALMMVHIPMATNNYWAFTITYQMLLTLGICTAITATLGSVGQVHAFVAKWVVIIFICTIIGLHFGRVEGSGLLGDENDFALVMNMGIPLAYFLFEIGGSWVKQLFYLFVVGVCICGNIDSLSRGGFIGLVVACLWCVTRARRRLLVVLLICVATATAWVATPASYWDEVESIWTQGAHEGTGEERAYLWGAAWRMFKDNCIIGVGPGNYNWNVQQYEPPGGFRGQKYRGGRPAHSFFFTLLPELGMVGTWLCAGILYEAARKRPPKPPSVLSASGAPLAEARRADCLRRGLIGALITFLATGVFLSVLYYPHLWLLTAVLVALGHARQAEEPAADDLGRPATTAITQPLA